MPDLAKELLSARVLGANDEERAQLAQVRGAIVDHLNVASQRVQDALLEYGSAYAALTAGRPAEFRGFLLGAPSMFTPIGEAIGVIKHIESFWRFRFPKDTPHLLQVDEAFQLYMDFHTTLGAMECLTMDTDLRITA